MQGEVSMPKPDQGSEKVPKIPKEIYTEKNNKDNLYEKFHSKDGRVRKRSKIKDWFIRSEES